MDKRNFYANKCAVLSSLYDFQIKLAHSSAVLDDNFAVTGEEVLEEIILHMSPAHTKAFYNALAIQIKVHEDMFGEIRLSSIADSK